MSKLVAIDPGRRTGWALFGGFADKRLIRAGYTGSSFEQILTIPSAPVVLIEQPRWYPREHKVDVNDLLDLSVLVGEIKHGHEACGGDVELVWPRTWKGSVPKAIMSQRIYDSMSEYERELLPRKKGHKHSSSAESHDHNVLDAVGLGLWKLGRLR